MTQKLFSPSQRPLLAGILFLVVGWLPAGLTASARNFPADPAAAADYPARPLRYTPIGTDFVITNGAEFFNRPLYGGSSGFRVDGGDKPEFSLYLPGRGGNLRLGFVTLGGAKWLNNAQQVVTRYRPGSLIHEVRDPLLGGGVLTLTTLALKQTDGLIVRAEFTGETPLKLLWAFGGVNGKKGRRDGDIGCEPEPVGKLFQLDPSECAGNVVRVEGNEFQITGKPGTISGVVSTLTPPEAQDARDWNTPVRLLNYRGAAPRNPILAGQSQLAAGQPVYLALQRWKDRDATDEPLEVYRETGGTGVMKKGPAAAPLKLTAAALPQIFAAAETERQALAERVVVSTPDPFINAAAAALNVAADAVWDERQGSYLHGAVAWRTRLLGWRGSYVGDELGWHDRTATHFAGFAEHQNTSPIPESLPPADAGANLARNEKALHSNGDLSKTHYDMNLVAVDVFFRHLLWTGDLNYARQLWPVIERHLAWERRLFRREFGPDHLPLYEAYCCIWASDDLAYNGGGATHASAYNLYHNRMAARVARLLGQDPAPYEQEADLIARGMQENLWLPDRGWFAEWKDLLGLQLVHPNAALWTFYHTVDSAVPTPFEAWQMSRFVDTQIAHIPLAGPGVPPGNFTLPTTSWMPYTWSLNNVVMAEATHTSLAYWQANRPDTALALFKGALLDSMYLGLCPGNVGMCTYFDADRHESQRDFADGCGATSRALVEGLFGVQPDLLAGEVTVRPGFPAAWNDARLRHPDFSLAFHRTGRQETYQFDSRFGPPIKLRWQVPALGDDVLAVTVNGQPAHWQDLTDSVGLPRVEIDALPATEQTVVITWSDRNLPAARPESTVSWQTSWQQDLGATIIAVNDPQQALNGLKFAGSTVQGMATGTPGHRTVFAQLTQGQLRWWQPVSLEIVAPATNPPAMDWTRPVTGKLEMVNLEPFFNDQVTQIFSHDYLAPRSPFCSLATPKQGIGSWCHPQETFTVNDNGLRSVASQQDGKIVLPDGIPLATPGAAAANNIAFVSQWTNFPAAISVPLTGQASHLYLLMAGSTGAMQSRFDNGEVVVTYADGSTARLALENPTTWWPIDQDYYIDDYAFARPEPLPVRVDLRTGKIRVLQMAAFKQQGHTVPGGAATVLDLPLDHTKPLQSLTVRALANEVVIGLMSATLAR